MKQELKKAADEFVNIRRDINHGYLFGRSDMLAAFEEGAKFQAKQNPWRNFKDERPKPNSHILRRMIHPDYKAYGKTIYYADFWDEDRPDRWEQDNDRVIYEWQYINI